MKAVLSIAATMVLLAGCASTEAPRPAAVERMYVIECGENHIKDLSRWTPGENVGKPLVFGDYCYLIKHAKGWMLWDTGNPDRLAAMPNGLTNPAGIITAFMKKPLADSLKEIGVAPGDIQYFAMSHSHGDHSGNANMFAASIVFMQQAEYDVMFSDTQVGIRTPDSYNDLKTAKRITLNNADYDVFGDGRVIIKTASGHTPGHQMLFLKLAKFGPLLLAGDLYHLPEERTLDRVPTFDFDPAMTRATRKKVDEFVRQTGATLWIQHDPATNAPLKKAPLYYE